MPNIENEGETAQETKRAKLKYYCAKTKVDKHKRKKEL